jgi:endonuclease VIII
VSEGDNLARIAAVLGETLAGQQIVAARGRPGGAQLERVADRRVEKVESRGKHLLIGFSGGLTLHTHLAMNGSWHRYRRGEPWQRSAERAVAVLETAQAVAVCFDAPTVELLDSRAIALHPVLARLGPDVAAVDFDAQAAVGRIRSSAGGRLALGEALLDQRLVAGLGNVYRSELCFIGRLSPFTPVANVSDEALTDLLRQAARLVTAAAAGGRRVTTGSPGRGSLYVYGRTNRACRRCATPIRSALHGEPPRRVYWCPTCQPRQP